MNNQKKFMNTSRYVFSKWSGNSKAVFLSLQKIIKIAVLPFIYSILSIAVLAQQEPDTIRFNQQVDLDEIEVIGQLSQVALQKNARFVTVIDSAEIFQKPVTSFQDLLQFVPGIDLRQRNENGVQADVSIRGGTFDQVMILLNGVNITDAQTGHHSLNLPISISDIKRVEVLHGPGARLFGADAFSGAINFVTSSKPGDLLSTEVSGGQYGYFKAHAGSNFSYRKINNYLSGSYSRSDGYTENTDFERFNVFYHGSTTLNNSTGSLQLGVSGKSFGANSFYSPKYPNQYEQISTGFGGISLKSGIHLPVTARAYFRRHYDHFILERGNPSFYENYHRTDMYGINSHVSYSSRFGTSSLGLNFKADEILSTVLGNDISPDRLIRGTDSTYYTKGAETYHYHLLAEHTISLDRFFMSLGLMAGTNTFLDKKIKIYPGIDGSYWITRKIKLSASVQKTLRSPTYTDLYYVDPSNRGNKDLNPEEAIGFDAGIKIYNGYWNWQAFYYYQTGDNHIAYVWQPEEEYRLAKNFENVKVQGIETNLQYVPEANWLKSFKIGYAYNTISKSLDDIPDNLKHKIVAGAEHQLVYGLSLFWNFRYMEREGAFVTYNSVDNTYPLSDYEPYWLMDIKLSYHFKFMRIFIHATNLFDYDYHEITSLKQPGRWIKAGAELKIKR